MHREGLSLDIATLYRYNILKRAAAREGKEFLGPQYPHAAMAEFISTAKAFGMRDWTERISFEQQIPYLEAMFVPPVPLPDFAQKYPAADVIDIQQGNFSLYSPGILSSLENDAAASDGKAAGIVGDTNEWAIQAQLAQFLDASPSKLHVYALARVDAKAGAPPTGAALECGIYDATNSKRISQQTVPMNQIAGAAYQRIDLGVHQLNNGMYIWFAPTRNPAVEKVYVDRVILIREK